MYRVETLSFWKRCIFDSLIMEPKYVFALTMTIQRQNQTYLLLKIILKVFIRSGSTLYWQKTFFVCWSQILRALLIFAKFPIFALFFSFLLAIDYGIVQVINLAIFSGTRCTICQIRLNYGKKGIMVPKKKLLFFVHNVEFWEFISYSDFEESLKN